MPFVEGTINEELDRVMDRALTVGSEGGESIDAFELALTLVANVSSFSAAVTAGAIHEN